MSREIAGVQYLRGLAAVAVVVDHAAATVASGSYFGRPVLGGFLYSGARGVDLFFLISGFIITVVSLDARWRPKVALADFVGRRARRILPMMWLAVVSWAVLRYIGRGEFDAIPYLRAMIASPVGALEPVHIWTLRHEFIFYAVFALTILGPRWAWPLLVVWCLSPLAMAGWNGPELVEAIAYPVNVEFGAGVLVGLLFLKRPASVRIPIDPMWIAALSVAALVAAGAVLGLNFHQIGKTTITAALCVPILLLGAYARCLTGPIRTLGLALGNASYAIYLFHPHLLSAVAGIWAAVDHGAPPMLTIPVLTAISVAGGLIVHWLVERPVMALSAAAVAASRRRYLESDQSSRHPSRAG